MKLISRVAVLVLAVWLGAGAAMAAQPPASRGGTPTPEVQNLVPRGQVVSSDDAERTRERLRAILRQYPPSVADVLRSDATLLTNAPFLATYPELTAFLAQHPEIIHNPSYYVGQNRNEWDSNLRARSNAVSQMGEMFAGFLVFCGIVTFMGLVAWSIRALVEHRRWLRQSKVQTDAHTKVLDRLASNDDLMAYIQTPAGQHFLQSAPIPVEGPRAFAAPVGRILFSAQAGVIAGFAGAALLYVSSRFATNADVSDVAPFLFTIGMVTGAVGLGFLAASAIAYVLSRRLGLLDEPSPSSSHA